MISLRYFIQKLYHKSILFSIFFTKKAIHLPLIEVGDFLLSFVKSLTFPIVLVQTLFLRNVIFNLFFEGNLKKGYDLTNVLLSYFSNSYLLIFIVLLLPILSEMYKILRLMANYINTNSSIDEPLDLKKKRKYSRIKTYNRRRK